MNKNKKVVETRPLFHLEFGGLNVTISVHLTFRIPVQPLAESLYVKIVIRLNVVKSIGQRNLR